MEIQLKQQFMEHWSRYFPGAELPISLYYTDEPEKVERAAPRGRQCLICDLAQVRRGVPLAFDVDAVGCRGGKRYLGFVQELRPGFEYFLSCGIPGQMEGERYKKTPALVEQLLKRMPPVQAPGRYIVFKRWDALDEAD